MTMIHKLVNHLSANPVLLSTKENSEKENIIVSINLIWVTMKVKNINLSI